MKISLVLEEVKLKRVIYNYYHLNVFFISLVLICNFKVQVQRLDEEVTKLNQMLIEKDSELYAKSLLCQNLETKLKKSQQDMKLMADTFNNRYLI